MHRVRLFVLWIMMFAVPFQGYAATAMVFCGPRHSDAVASASAEPSKAHDHALHQPGDGHSDQHQEAKQPAKDGTGKAASAEPDAMHKCGTCGTCGACHGSALTGNIQLAVFHDPSSADLAEPSIAVVTFTPHVLDKPPRA